MFNLLKLLDQEIYENIEQGESDLRENILSNFQASDDEDDYFKNSENYALVD